MKFYLEGPGGLPGAKQAREIRTALNVYFEGNLTVTGALTAGSEVQGAEVITATGANAFAVGANGATNPVLNVDASAASVATGLNVKGNTAAGGVLLTVISTGTHEELFIDGKGTNGTIKLNVNTGANVVIGGPAYLAYATGSVNALCVGPNTATNPAFNVDTSTASSATGLNIKSAAAGSGLAVTTRSSGTDENLTVAAKGAGTITFNPAVVATAGGAANDGIKFGSLGVGLFTGTGAPSFSAMNGSIYVDSNATTTTTRIYVNKSGAGTAGTTWTALTTAA